MANHVMITGATGFIGNHLVATLAKDSRYKLSIAVRSGFFNFPESVEVHKLKQSNPFDNLSLCRIDTVIHLAALAHEPGRYKTLDEFRAVNVLATITLAKRAALSGVKRFIFLSSIGVNGGCSKSPFTSNDVPFPEDYYSVSKYEAELELKEVAESSGMDLVVIRPPLVYGPDAPGNFLKLVSAVRKGFFLPLGSVHNKRTLISVYNLVDFISVCVEHPMAANEIFVVGDSEDVSTSELIKKIGQYSGRRARLLYVPNRILLFLLTVLGKRRVAEKICGDLQIDSSKACERLGWKQPFSLDEGLQRCFLR